VRRDFGKAVSRILSAPEGSGGENHLSKQPVPGTRSAARNLERDNSGVPYLALHPMGFSVPPRLRLERRALTPPFHPYPGLLRSPGGLFSVALSVGTPRGMAARVYPATAFLCWPRRLRGIAPFGVRTFLLPRITSGKAILRPSEIRRNLPAERDFIKHGTGAPALKRFIKPLTTPPG